MVDESGRVNWVWQAAWMLASLTPSLDVGAISVIVVCSVWCIFFAVIVHIVVVEVAAVCSALMSMRIRMSSVGRVMLVRVLF